MNWPRPGSPEHGEPSHEQDASERAADHHDVDDGQPADDTRYDELRSETDGAEERWQVPADPAGVDSTWDRWEDDGGPAAEPPAPGHEAEPGDAQTLENRDVSADDPPIPGPEEGATGPPGTGEAPAPTRQDRSSAAEDGGEPAGFTHPAFSPHTGSWDADLEGSDAPGAGRGDAPAGDRAEPPADHGRARHPEGGQEPAHPAGHGEGDVRPESVEPHGLGLPPDLERPPEPSPGPEAPPAVAGHDQPGGGAREPFHGEPSGVAVAPGATAVDDTLASLDSPARHATVICVANQKGGVGKTTTTVSLGAALAMEGAQVLVVDLDPQGNATTGLGLRAQEGAPSTYRVIVEQMDVEDASEPTAVRGLHALPSSLDLAGAEIELVPAFSRENRLKQALDAVRDLYDVVLIDCPPSLGLLTINALVAADQVLVPIQCEYYALEGLGQLMRTVKLVADSLNRGLEVGGVVLTMFDGRTNLSQQVVDEVRGYFGDVAYQTIVPRTVRLSEAPSYGQPIGVFDASSRGARAYQRLAREVASRLGLELRSDDVSPLDRLLGGPAAAPTIDDAAPLPTDLDPEDVPGTAPAEPSDHRNDPARGAGATRPFHGEHHAGDPEHDPDRRPGYDVDHGARPGVDHHGDHHDQWQ